MSYQICPLCAGSGVKFKERPVLSMLDVAYNMMLMPMPYRDAEGKFHMREFDNKCPVCKGKKVINSDTGLPPIEVAPAQD